MQRLNDDVIILTQSEIDDIRDFIDSSLDRAWDQYTDNHLCPGVSWEDGKRRMNSDMYDFMKNLYNV